MKIPSARADRFCAAPEAGIRLVLIYGSNEGLVRARAEACVKAVAEDPGDPFRVTSLDPALLRDEPGRLADEAAALSLIGGRRAVRLRGATEAAVPAIRSCLALSATESLVIAEAGPLTPRSGLRRLCEQEATLAAIACYDESAEDAAALIEALCAKRGLTVASETAAWLAERLGSDRRQIESGVEKLAVYLGDPGPEGGDADDGGRGGLRRRCGRGVRRCGRASGSIRRPGGAGPGDVAGALWRRPADHHPPRRGPAARARPSCGRCAGRRRQPGGCDGRPQAAGVPEGPNRVLAGDDALAQRPRGPRVGAADPS